MELGYFANIAGPGRHDEMSVVLDELREQASFCEDAGFDTFWLTEHHFGHEGYELVPNPFLVGADIAARTNRIRIGQAASIVTFWHPLRLAEDIAMLDQLSKGRVELGIGRGLYGREALNLNTLADPRDQEKNRALFEETYEILVNAMSNRFFSHKGEFYEFPAPGLKWNHPMSPHTADYMDMEKGIITKMALSPRPYQRPHPPIWQVIDSPRSIQWSAQQGVKGMFWMPTLKELRTRFELYRSVASEAQGREVELGEGIALVRDCYVAESMEAAKREAGEAVLNTYKWICHFRGLGNLMDPGEQVGPNTELSYEFLHPRNLLFGTPDYIVEKINELKAELNLKHLILWTTHIGLPQDRIMNSLRLFRDEVLPRIK